MITRAAFALISVYNVLPQFAVDLTSVSEFQRHLQKARIPDVQRASLDRSAGLGTTKSGDRLAPDDGVDDVWNGSGKKRKGGDVVCVFDIVQPLHVRR